MARRKKFEIIRVDNFPEYVLSALINNDYEGLTREDLDNFLKFMECSEMGKATGFSVVEGSRNEFCSRPAFGLACSTVAIDFLIEK